MIFPTQEELKILREMYPKGTRVVLLEMRTDSGNEQTQINDLSKEELEELIKREKEYYDDLQKTIDKVYEDLGYEIDL